MILRCFGFGGSTRGFGLLALSLPSTAGSSRTILFLFLLGWTLYFIRDFFFIGKLAIFIINSSGLTCAVSPSFSADSSRQILDASVYNLLVVTRPLNFRHQLILLFLVWLFGLHLVNEFFLKLGDTPHPLNLDPLVLEGLDRVLVLQQLLVVLYLPLAQVHVALAWTATALPRRGGRQVLLNLFRKCLDWSLLYGGGILAA